MCVCIVPDLSCIIWICFRFIPSKFEEIFRQHARTHPDALTSDELKEMLKENRAPRDFHGWYVSMLFFFWTFWVD